MGLFVVGWVTCVLSICIVLVGGSPTELEIPFLSYDLSTGPLFFPLFGYRYVQQQIFAGGSFPSTSES